MIGLINSDNPHDMLISVCVCSD